MTQGANVHTTPRSRNAQAASAAGDEAVCEHGPAPSLYDKLPGPLRAIIGFLYLDGVKPDDDFLTRLQKLILATGVFIAVCAGGYVCVNVWFIEAEEGGHSTAGHIVSTTTIYALVSIWLACFALHKAAPQIPLALITSLWMGGTFVNVLLLSLAYPDYPCPHMFIQLGLLALSLRSRFGYAIVAASAVGYVVAAYNEAAHLPATATESLKLATVPDPFRYTTFWQRFRGQANEYAVYVIIFACLELQMREAGRLTAASRASAELAAELAHALSRYDTAAAARRLEEARSAAGGKGDTTLLDAFEAIVANLNSYRPHLPNWVLPRNCGTTSGAEEDGTDDEADDAVVEVFGGSTRRARDHTHGRRPGSERSAASESTLRICDATSRSSLERSMSSLSRSSRGASPARMGASGSLSPLALRSITAKANGGAMAKATRVVVFNGAFRLNTGTAGSEPSRADYAIAAHAFVDRVFALADRAAGAVHTFVGDQLLVSWNAAAPAVQPEVKAARFVHKLGDDAGHAAVRVCGVASAFAAHVVMAGTAQQRSLALSAARAGGDTFAERAQRLAARFGALLVDGRIWRAANHAMEFRGAGIIDMAQPFQSNYGRPATAARLGPSVDPVFQQRVARNSEPRLSVLRPVFEVVGEQAETNDEWLYVLQQQQQELDAHAGAAARPNATLCSAVTALSEGKRDVALKLLDIAKSSDAARRPIVAALLEEHGITS